MEDVYFWSTFLQVLPLFLRSWDVTKYRNFSRYTNQCSPRLNSIWSTLNIYPYPIHLTDFLQSYYLFVTASFGILRTCFTQELSALQAYVCLQPEIFVYPQYRNFISFGFVPHNVLQFIVACNSSREQQVSGHRSSLSKISGTEKSLERNRQDQYMQVMEVEWDSLRTKRQKMMSADVISRDLLFLEDVTQGELLQGLKLNIVLKGEKFLLLLSYTG